MPLPTFKSKDDVPEAVRDGYIERDGEWVPDVEDVKGLRANRDELIVSERKLKAKLRDLTAQLEGKSKGLTDEEIAARKKEIDDAVAPFVQERDEARASLRTLQLDSRVKAMFGDAGANPKRIGDLFTLVGARFDLSTDGTPVLKDKPTTDLAKYIGETVAIEYPEFFLTKQKAGDAFVGGAGGPAREDMAKLLTTNPAALLSIANQQKAA